MMRMTPRQTKAYHACIRKIRADEEWRAIRAISVPHMSEDERTKVIDSLNRDMGRESAHVITGDGVSQFIKDMSAPPR
jgi:hypothetical protein